MIRISPRNVPDRDYEGIFIQTMLLSYGTDSGLFDVWEILDGGKQTGAVFRMNGNVRISGAVADFGELREFLGAVGCASVSASDGILLGLGMEPSGVTVMEYRGGEAVVPQEVSPVAAEDLREIYSLVFGAELRGRAFSEWYADISHRMRHGFSRGVCVRVNGEIASVALTVAETGNAAVIGCVSTKKEYRGRGFASSAVKELAEKLYQENRAVFVAVKPDGPKAMYRRLGFVEKSVENYENRVESQIKPDFIPYID